MGPYPATTTHCYIAQYITPAAYCNSLTDIEESFGDTSKGYASIPPRQSADKDKLIDHARAHKNSIDISFEIGR